jgi:hypothetical protein
VAGKHGEIRRIDPAVAVEVTGRTIRAGGYAEERYEDEDK